MQQSVISIHDTKTGLWHSPFVVRHIGEAIRDYDAVKKDPQTRYGANPADYEMFKVADYDDQTGEITKLEKYIHLG